MRRMQREQKKAKTATYNLTKEQLDAMVEERISTRIKEAKEAATYDVNASITYGSINGSLLAGVLCD